MQPASTQTQGHTQDRLAHHTPQGPGYVHRPSPVIAPLPTPFGFTQPVMPHHDHSQPRIQGNFRDTLSTQPGGGNDAYYWGNSVNGYGRTSTVPLGTGAPPPWRSGEYASPYPPYGHFAQGGINLTGFPVVPQQVSNYGMNFFQPSPGTSAPQPQNNQGATPVWQLCNCWVNYETQGELHLTIAFRKFPFV